jgi:cellobiose phosphorylase
MDYGYFLDKEREYVIIKYDTNWPWINYLSNGRYCVLLSHLGGGYSFFEDPRFQRITRYRYNNVPMDRPGKYIYIRDEGSDSYWTPTWQPVGKKPEHWKCHHGLGYTRITSVNEQIFSQVLYFVPLEDNLEIWNITLSNLGRKKRRLHLFPYVEFALFDAVEEFISHPNLHYFSTADFDDLDNVIYYDFFMPGRFTTMGKVFFSISEKVEGYDCDREEFVGLYRSESNPLVVEEGKSRNSKLIGGNAIGSLHSSVELAPDEKKTLLVILGVTKDYKESARKYIEKYSSLERVNKAFQLLKQNWQSYLGKTQIKTPDQDVNSMINIWNQYQCKVNFDWSRYASYFHTGTGRGIGFRDTSQDIMGVVHSIPQKAKKKIKLLAKNMYKDGHSYHLFFPTVGKGDSTKYSDDHLWIINAVSSYIRETGDMDIIEDRAPYIEGSKGSIYQHMVRAIEYTLNNVGPHNLPRMFYADWNDCLNDVDKEGRGESVWTGFQLHLVLKQLEEIAELSGKLEDKERFHKIAEKVKDIINEVAWDGQWYIRAFTDEGKPLGSKDNREGKIYLNSQSWAVFSGVATNERAEICMNSVREFLNTECGLKLLHPPYRSFPKGVGSLLNYPPGLKENAAIFCHANTWAIIAEAMLGRGDYAYQYYSQILPPNVSRRVGNELYRIEPYVYCQFIFGPDHPEHGRASHSWLTGTAVWAFRAFVDWILGIRPTFKGLLIDPCLPTCWDGYKAERVFRGAKYEIKVKKPKGISKGISKVIFDKEELDSYTLPVLKDGKTHQVEVYMG